MRTARRFLIFTVLMVVLISIIFLMPEDYEFLQSYLGLAALLLLLFFTFVYWRWRSKTGKNIMVEDEVGDNYQELAGKG